MEKLPHWIQVAVDLGALTFNDDGKLVNNRTLDPDTVVGCARIVEKLRPELHKPTHSSADQEAIVLSRIFISPSKKARQMWMQLRTALGIGHGDRVPRDMWTTDVFKEIGSEIDRIYLGEAATEVLSSRVIIEEYNNLDPYKRKVSLLDFNKTVAELADPATLEAYGDADCEWEIAIDLLRNSRCRAIAEKAAHFATLSLTGGTDIVKVSDYMTEQGYKIKSYLSGTINSRGNSKDIVDLLYTDEDGNLGMIDRITNTEKAPQPISSGLKDIDLDMEGGTPNPDGPVSYGRVFCLAARTGTGKTVIGANVCASIAAQGYKAGFVSIELDKQLIEARIWASVFYHLRKRGRCDISELPTVGNLERPNEHNREYLGEVLQKSANALKDVGGGILLECPWGGDVEEISEIIRSMKAKDPKMVLCCVDHFHCMQRHKGAAREEHLMLEDRAKRLMSLAKELKIDILLLAQMNRSNLKGDEDMTLGEILGSDGLSHYCHAVWGVRKFKKEEYQKMDTRSGKPLELWHLKRRGGQYIWDDNTESLREIDDSIEKGTLHMSYKNSAVAMPIPLGILKQRSAIREQDSGTNLLPDGSEPPF